MSTADDLLREIVPPEDLFIERDNFDAESWLLRARAYLNAPSSPALDSTLADSMRSAGDYADEWQTRCGTCNRTIKGFCIYVEDRDGRGFDGGASVLASFLFCSPRCLKAYAESYDNDKPARAALAAAPALAAEEGE